MEVKVYWSDEGKYIRIRLNHRDWFLSSENWKTELTNTRFSCELREKIESAINDLFEDSSED